jgi:cell fate (sporulation/competence/biofilm development) regulator YmcA (YheA/YmcA/DUF963 family)
MNNEALLFGEKNIWILHQQNQQLRSGLLNLNEVKCASKAMHAVDSRSGLDENIKKVHKINLNDRKVKLIEKAETLKISKKRVQHIVHEYLDMQKLFTKWPPRVLTID